MTTTVTTHDIEADGQNYILEWRRDESGEEPGWISITGACDDQPEDCEWFVNNATVPSWCCNSHMFDGTGDYPASSDHPEDCDFKEEYDNQEDCDHETYDYQEFSSEKQFAAILAKNNIAKELASAEPNINWILSNLQDIEAYTGELNQPTVMASYEEGR
jgi:hypothetical protein